MDLDDGMEARWAPPDENGEGAAAGGERDLDADEDDICHGGKVRRNALMQIVIDEYNAQ
jgi:hypothetical protein